MAYALIAVGYSLVFGILRLINFSHGSIYAFGAHIALLFVGFQFGVIPAVLLSIVFTGLLGVAIDKAALAPLRKKNSIPIAALITTIGISNIIQNLLMIFFGSEKKAFPAFFDFRHGEPRYRKGQLHPDRHVRGVARSVGGADAAGQQNQNRSCHACDGTECQSRKPDGIDVNFVIGFTFFLGGASAAIAGSLISGTIRSFIPGMGFMAGLKAFAAAVLGGIGSLPGSVARRPCCGRVESLPHLLGSTYRDSMAFIILIIVLIFKPTGFFGKKTITKVYHTRKGAERCVDNKSKETAGGLHLPYGAVSGTYKLPVTAVCALGCCWPYRSWGLQPVYHGHPEL
jgi:branched-chain amino acid transport system permease protein